jgi:hypothetical protein
MSGAITTGILSVYLILFPSSFDLIPESKPGSFGSYACTKTIVWTDGPSKGLRASGVPCSGQAVQAVNIDTAVRQLIKSQCSMKNAKVEQLLVFVLPSDGKIFPFNCPQSRL